MAAMLMHSGVAFADAGCRGCFDPLGCMFVCAMAFSILLLPAWALATAVLLALHRRWRRVLPHLVALPLFYVGAFAYIGLFEFIGKASLVFGLGLPLLWYGSFWKPETLGARLYLGASALGLLAIGGLGWAFTRDVPPDPKFACKAGAHYCDGATLRDCETDSVVLDCSICKFPTETQQYESSCWDDPGGV